MNITAGVSTTQNKPSGPVLVAVDLGPHSDAAVLLGAQAAQCLGVGLSLLHVVHDPIDRPGFYSREQADNGPLLPAMELAREMAAQLLPRLCATHAELTALAAADWRLVSGLPQQRILEVSAGIDAGMLVLGAAARRVWPMARLRPSLATRLGRHSTIPVIVAAAQAGAAMCCDDAGVLRLMQRSRDAMAA